MTNQPKIVTEWHWQPAMHPSSRHALYENLIWRGLVLGTIETFYDVGPWYGNIGDGRTPLDYTYRTGAMGNHEACRRRVEANVLQALNEGLDGAGAAGASAGAVKAGPKNIERAFLLAADKAAASARSAAAANVVGPLCEAYGAIANEMRRLAKMVLNGEEIRDTNGLPWAPVVEPVKAGDEVVREALKTAIDHIEHMSAWIALRNAGYSFESLGEDMPGMKNALSSQEARNEVPALHDRSVVPDPADAGVRNRTDGRPGDARTCSAAGGGLAAVRDDGNSAGRAGADGLSEALIRACSTDLLRKEEIDAIGEIGRQVIAYIERVTEYQLYGGVQAGIQFTINQLAFELLVMRPKRLTADAVKSAIRAASPEREIVALIDQLRSNEGDSVTILCDNPDFNGLPDRVIVVNGAWTNWQDRRFGADTLVQALRAAVKAREAK
jgi:hypothetical protein